MKHESSTDRALRWLAYLLIAAMYMAVVTMWVIEAGRPYP